MTDGGDTLPRVVLVATDLMTAARIEGAVTAAGGTFTRVDAPDQLPAAEARDLLLVDWSERRPGWAESLRQALGGTASSPPRVILFGPHTDLAAHSAARDAGLGPMLARSGLYSTLGTLLRDRQSR